MQQLEAQHQPLPHAKSPVWDTQPLAEEMQQARGREPERSGELALRIVAVGLIADELDDLLDARVEKSFFGPGSKQEIQAALDRFLLRVVLEDPTEDFENLRVVQARHRAAAIG